MIESEIFAWFVIFSEQKLWKLSDGQIAVFKVLKILIFVLCISYMILEQTFNLESKKILLLMKNKS